MTRAKQFWAKQYAANWTKPPLPTEAQAALGAAYLEGFDKMRDLSVDMLRNFGGGNPFDQLAILIKAIGTTEVDPDTGERIDE